MPLPTRLHCFAVAFALVVALFGTVACSGSDEASPDIVATDADAQTPPDSSAEDSVEPDVDTTSPPDGTIDGGADLIASNPEFVLGTNVVFEARPASFTPLTDGDEVPITFGSQGAWMVVLAFKERDSVSNPFTIEAEVTIDGGEPDTLIYQNQETFPGGDGYTYYYNFFLALSRVDPPAKGTPATITCTITDADGDVIEVTRTVITGDAT